MRLIDISNQTFGRLTVLRKSLKPCLWECSCSCGTLTLVTGTNLRSGNTTSCGCVHREQLVDFNKKSKTMCESWLADMSLYRRKVEYRRNRKSKGIGTNQFSAKDREVLHTDHPSLVWHLTLEQYVSLVTADCYYCGRPPHQKPQGACMASSMLRNGIDRMDNNKGYLPDNCVPCCSYCNKEKRAQSLDQFVENTKRRYENLKARGLITK